MIVSDQLVRRVLPVAGGDAASAESAFEEAMARHAGRLHGLAMTIVADPYDAQDVVQETMASAWRAWSRRRSADPAAWLSRICVNHAIGVVRKRRRASWVPFGDGLLTASATAFRESLAAELLDIDRAFRRLPARQRAVFALHVHYGYTLSQCAELMGCRPGTARSHLGRAMATLKRETSG